MSAQEQRWLEIGKAVERAARELPDGAELQLELEQGSGSVRLFIAPIGDDDPGYVNAEWDGDEFADRIENAINYAINDAANH
jgi:hypothetical protein